MIPAPPKKSGRLDEDKNEDDDLEGPGAGVENWRAEQTGRRTREAERRRDMLGLVVVRCGCGCKKVGQDERKGKVAVSDH